MHDELYPRAVGRNPQMDLDRRGFYEYHAAMMEPWDGPAAVCFTDGKLIGATLDRNGLRPCRFQVTTDGLVVLASEAGVLPADPKEIRQKGRLQPGRMFLVDTRKAGCGYEESRPTLWTSRTAHGSLIPHFTR